MGIGASAAGVSNRRRRRAADSLVAGIRDRRWYWVSGRRMSLRAGDRRWETLKIGIFPSLPQAYALQVQEKLFPYQYIPTYEYSYINILFPWTIVSHTFFDVEPGKQIT